MREPPGVERKTPFKAQQISTRETICAIQVMSAEESGKAPAGLFTQIRSDVPLEMCGDGWSENTVLVRSNGISYIVFRQDLQSRKDRCLEHGAGVAPP